MYHKRGNGTNYMKAVPRETPENVWNCLRSMDLSQGQWELLEGEVVLPGLVL